MEKLLQSLFHYGSLVRGYPPAISPALDDFELLQFMRPAPQEGPKSGFRVLLNVALLEPSEVQVDVIAGKLLEVRAAHGRKNNTDGLWMTRDLTYTYEIPEEEQGKTLHAEWSEDGYILVQTKSMKEKEKPGEDRVRLIPERVPYAVRPVVEVGVVRDMVEDIRNKAQTALRYIRFHGRQGNTDEEKKAGEKVTMQFEGGSLMSTEGSEDSSSSHKPDVREHDGPPIHFYCA